MIVRAHQIERISLAMKAPLRTATGEYRTREGFVLRLDGGTGAFGVGEAMPLQSFGTESLASAVSAARHACEALTAATLPETSDELDAQLDQLAEGLDACPAARNAIETALLDLLAKLQRRPLRQLLSENAREFVTVNAILSPMNPVQLADAARRAVEEGFTTLKVKVAVLSLSQDLERLAALRRAVGPDVRIRIDANGGWAPEDAKANLDALSEFGLDLCEQPVAASELKALRELRGAVRCRIAADESASSLRNAHAVVTEGAADVLVLRPMVLGGNMRTVRLCREAKSHGIDCYVASSLESGLGRAAALQLAAALPECGLASGLATGALFENEPETPFVPVRGAIALGHAPGLGLEQRRAA